MSLFYRLYDIDYIECLGFNLAVGGVCWLDTEDKLYSQMLCN